MTLPPPALRAAALNDLDDVRSNIRTLVELPEAAEPIVSCYLNVGSHRETLETRASEVRRALAPPQRGPFDAAMVPVRNLMVGARADARAIVAFSRAGTHPFFTALQLGVTVDEVVSVDSRPSIYGLVELKDTYHRYVVLLVTDDYARILEISLGAVTADVWAARPDLRSHIGEVWGRERYQNHRRDRAEHFVHEKMQVLERLVAKRGHSHLIIAGTPALVARARASLPPRLEPKLVDTVRATGHMPTADLVAATIARFVENEERESRDAASLLVDELTHAGLAVAGTDASLAALELGQVDMLVLSASYQSPPGRRCLACGAVATGASAPSDRCRRCRATSCAPVDIRDELVTLAERHDSRIEVVRDASALMDLEGVGCLLRYQLGWRPEPA
jgi:hypothetical protein